MEGLSREVQNPNSREFSSNKIGHRSGWPEVQRCRHLEPFRTVKDLKLPPVFITHIASSIQSQLADFRSFDGQEMYAGEKIVCIKLDLRVHHTLIRDPFLWDMNNFESDPEEFAKNFCKDLGIEDPEVAPAIAFAIREQLYEIAIQSSARESRISKKGRRGVDHTPTRKRKEWDIYEPIVDILSNEEVDALEAREERNAR